MIGVTKRTVIVCGLSIGKRTGACTLGGRPLACMQPSGRAGPGKGEIMKAAMSAIALAGLLAAGAAGAADAPKLSPETMAKAQEAYIAAINAKDLKAILALYADDAVVEDPAGSPPKRGKQIEEFYAGVVKGTPKLEIVTVNPSTADSSAMFFQVKAGPVSIDVIDVMTFNAAGKITGMRAYVRMPKPPAQ